MSHFYLTITISFPIQGAKYDMTLADDSSMGLMWLHLIPSTERAEVVENNAKILYIISSIWDHMFCKVECYCCNKQIIIKKTGDT